jgi:single-strand DNA-binding protein
MNKLILLGRLGKDAELVYSAEGKPRTRFTVATDYGPRDKKETEWTDCVLFGDAAENLSQYLTKGKQVLVEGRIKTRSWEHEGTKHYKTECLVNHVELVGDKPKGQAKPDFDDLPFE